MKNTIKFLVIFFGLVLVFASSSSAQTGDSLKSKVDTSNIIYPITELGSCKDKVDCAKFCGVPANMTACVNYAEKNNLLSGEDLRISKEVVNRIANGMTPGSCKSEEECAKYCSGNVEHIKECVSFADELKIIPEKELTEAKKILNALENGATMPGGCKTKNECENYCAVASHIDECLSFAEASDILPKDELDQAKKVASFLKEGKTPGKCQNKNECEKYCSDSANFNECISFAEEAGFVSKEDADIARKAGGVGPGGCKSKDECEAYCNKQENADACAQFAIDKGLVSEEDQKLIKSGVDEMIKALDSMPPEMRTQVESCMKSSIGEEEYGRILSKVDKPTKDIGDKIQSCFGNLPKVNGKEGGMAPSEEDINKIIPGGTPKEMQDKIREQIKNQMENKNDSPSEDNIPTSGSFPPIPSGGAMPAPSKDGTDIGGPSCSNFISIPSVQYCQTIQDESARETCIKCKS